MLFKKKISFDRLECQVKICEKQYNFFCSSAWNSPTPQCITHTANIRYISDFRDKIENKKERKEGEKNGNRRKKKQKENPASE